MTTFKNKIAVRDIIRRLQTIKGFMFTNEMSVDIDLLLSQFKPSDNILLTCKNILKNSFLSILEKK